MLIDLKCKCCGCGPEEHPGTSVGCQCGQCYEYKSPLAELELAVALAVVSKEAEELRDFRRLVNFDLDLQDDVVRQLFQATRTLLERMNEDKERKGG